TDALGEILRRLSGEPHGAVLRLHRRDQLSTLAGGRALVARSTAGQRLSASVPAAPEGDPRAGLSRRSGGPAARAEWRVSRKRRNTGALGRWLCRHGRSGV